MSYRSNYWSCMEFSNKIREFAGMPAKLNSGTSEEWRDWEKICKRDYPFSYWVTDVVLDKIQNFFMYPMDVVDDIRTYIKNRFSDKIHYLPTGLTPGKYYEVQDRMLHGLFETFIDFIEVEKAWMMVAFDDEKFKKYQYPDTFKYRLLRWTKKFRCPEAGIDYLHWEMSLVDEHNDINARQRDSARAQLGLYNWWKTVRPARIDPYELSGLNEFYTALEDADNDVFLSFADRSDNPDYLVKHDYMSQIEERYDAEDEEMMIKLIKMRKDLWT